jgi:hypothetical protein
MGMRCALKTLKLSIFVSNYIMSKSVLISLLAQGNNGNEILSILDALAADSVSENVSEVSYPTLQPIEF